MTGRLHHLVIGTLVSLAVVLGTAAISAWPQWQSIPEDHALLRLSFDKSGARNCRDRTEQELAALPPNMRTEQICDSRRAPIYVELDIDGETVLASNVKPTGLSGTGPSRVYQRFELPAGRYDIAVRMRDDPATEGFSTAASKRVTLAPGQSLAIDYDDTSASFFFE